MWRTPDTDNGTELAVEGLARSTRNERFAFDSYRRLIQMYGEVVDGVPGNRFEQALAELKTRLGAKQDVDLSADDLAELDAGVLAEIFPEKRTELFDFAHRAVWGRVFGGVHFPSDLVGGWMLAEPLVSEFGKSAAFRAQVEKCRAEMAPFVTKAAP